LAEDVTEDDIREAFEKYGNIVDLFKMKMKPIAFIKFDNQEELQKAVEGMNKT